MSDILNNLLSNANVDFVETDVTSVPAAAIDLVEIQRLCAKADNFVTDAELKHRAILLENGIDPQTRITSNGQFVGYPPLRYVKLATKVVNQNLTDPENSARAATPETKTTEEKIDFRHFNIIRG